MQILYQVLGLVGGAFVIWYLYRTIKARPDQFSREKLRHSFFSMGILAIILILFVAILVLVVRT